MLLNLERNIYHQNITFLSFVRFPTRFLNGIALSLLGGKGREEETGRGWGEGREGKEREGREGEEINALRTSRAKLQLRIYTHSLVITLSSFMELPETFLPIEKFKAIYMILLFCFVFVFYFF